MPSTPIRVSMLPEEPGPLRPRRPTIVVASNKSGTWKTTLALAMAERLALAHRHVLLLTCDPREDVRARLGVKPTEPRVTYRFYGKKGGTGIVVVVGLRGSKAVDLLYRVRPIELGIPHYFELVVVDTPPEERAASLPGVMLVAPIDGADARNLITALRHTPANTDIFLVRAGWLRPDAWARTVGAVEDALGRSVSHLADPLLREEPIAKAHAAAQSVWCLPRDHDGTRQFLRSIDALVRRLCERIERRQEWPEVPPSDECAPWMMSWDEPQ